jgi:glycine cleavage system H protein
MAFMKVDDYEVPDDLYYSREHMWLKVEDGKCRIGLTDYAQKALHEIVFVDLPQTGAKVTQTHPIGAVESVKAVADIISLISGEVIETNGKLLDSPELINKQPYGEGWIILIKPSNLNVELETLMNAEGYCNFLKTIIGKK